MRQQWEPCVGTKVIRSPYSKRTRVGVNGISRQAEEDIFPPLVIRRQSRECLAKFSRTHRIVKRSFDGFGQTEEMEYTADADALVVHFSRGLDDTLILGIEISIAEGRRQKRSSSRREKMGRPPSSPICLAQRANYEAKSDNTVY